MAIVAQMKKPGLSFSFNKKVAKVIAKTGCSFCNKTTIVSF